MSKSISKALARGKSPAGTSDNVAPSAVRRLWRSSITSRATLSDHQDGADKQQSSQCHSDYRQRFHWCWVQQLHREPGKIKQQQNTQPSEHAAIAFDGGRQHQYQRPIQQQTKKNARAQHGLSRQLSILWCQPPKATDGSNQ